MGSVPKHTCFIRQFHHCPWKSIYVFLWVLSSHLFLGHHFHLKEWLADRRHFFFFSCLEYLADIFSKMNQVSLLLLQEAFVTNQKIQTFTSKLKLWKTYFPLCGRQPSRTWSIFHPRTKSPITAAAHNGGDHALNVECTVHVCWLVMCEFTFFLYSVTKVWLQLLSFQANYYNWLFQRTLFQRGLWKCIFLYMICCWSITKSCMTLCNPMDCRTPGSLVLHCLLELAQIHVRWVSEGILPPHPLLSPSPPALNLPQHQGLFQWVISSHLVAKILELQLQHQSFQWIFRLDCFRTDWFDLLAAQETL